MIRHSYIWQKTDLRQMVWQEAQFASLLAEIHLLRGTLLGKLSLLGFKVQDDTRLEALASEIIHSSAIEGEHLNRDSVRSSVACHLGLPYEGLPPTDHHIEGVLQLMIDTTQHAQTPLTAERPFAWHVALFPWDIVPCTKSLLLIGTPVPSLCRSFREQRSANAYTMPPTQPRCSYTNGAFLRG